MEIAFKRTCEATPDPKRVVAMGPAVAAVESLETPTLRSERLGCRSLGREQESSERNPRLQYSDPEELVVLPLGGKRRTRILHCG